MSQNTVTNEQVQAIIDGSKIEIQTVLDKCTIVTCQLPNGFILIESSACVDPANYDEKLGADICMKRITNKIWELEGYCLQNDLSKSHGYDTEDLAEMDAEFGFDLAMALLKEGVKVKRKLWGGYWFIPDKPYAGECCDPKTGLHHQFQFNSMIAAKLKDDGGYAPATPYQEDLLAEDWMIAK